MPKERAGDERESTSPSQQPAPGGAGQSRPLTDRELQVLTNVARGMTNRQIGEALGISALTVRNHMRTIQRKLSTTDRTQAVVMAIGSGWIPIQIVLPGEGEAAGTSSSIRAPAEQEPGQ